MGVKYGICENIFAIEKIPMQVSVHLYSRPSRVSFIMLPFSIVAILLPPHFSQNSPNGPKCFFLHFHFSSVFLKVIHISCFTLAIPVSYEHF